MGSEHLTSRPFRVIVVGAGIAGLTASHCLQKAGINHIIFERHTEVAPNKGFTLSVYPNSMRILHQLGFLNEVESACVPIDRSIVRLPDSKVISDIGLSKRWRENHGKDFLLFERQKFLQILYDNLPDKSPIQLGYPVKTLRHLQNGIEVTLGDGHVEVGDILLGCDGVHSLVRSLMWEYANQTVPGSITVREKRRIKANWKCLTGTGPAAPELGQHDSTVVFNEHYSFSTMTQPDRTFWGVYFRLKSLVIWPRQQHYTAEDAERLAHSIADNPVTESLLFGDLWRKRERAVVVNIEQGMLDHWHWGRIVLAGDSVHKVTPHSGLGGNSAIEKLSQATLQHVFAAYKSERYARMKQILDLSNTMTRVQAWDSAWHKFLARCVFPRLPDTFSPDSLGKIIRGAPRIEFINMVDFPRGRLEWKDEEIKRRKRTNNI
ncbi:hypothetical protein M434DRAFT_24241 [Hypoxylon sp. CO27-5]|nr:hypothetical protein M434DRAFT_24241 [Hypoxylon sp. CO27-5]